MINEKIKNNDIDVTEYYFASNGKLLDQIGEGIFQAQSNNTNVIKVHIEDGSVGEELNVINFTPLNIRRNYTTHNFYLHPFGTTERVITGEKEQRTFSSYYIVVPKLVLRNDSGKQVINEVSVIRKYGVKNLGIFNSVNELEGRYPASKELKEELATAYVLEGNNSSFYQVELGLHSNTYEWTEKGQEVSFSGKQKQYGIAKAIVNPGFESTLGTPDIDVSTYQMIMQIINEMQHDLNNLDGVIGGLEIIDTDSINNKTIKVGKNVYLKTELKVNEKENNMLKVNKDGVYVKHDETKLDEKEFELFKEGNTLALNSLRDKDIALQKQINTLDDRFVVVDENITTTNQNLKNLDRKVDTFDDRIKDVDYLSKQNQKNIFDNRKDILDLNNKKMDKSWTGMNFVGDIIKSDELLVNRGGKAYRITAERLIDFLVAEEFELIKVVSKLPEQDISSNTIYFVPSDNPGENNIYIEYVYANGAWEKLGEFQADFDLSDYFKKDETYSRSQMNELLSFKADKDEIPTKFSDLENDIELVNAVELSKVKTELDNSINELNDNKVDKVDYDKHLEDSNSKFEGINKELSLKANIEYVDDLVSNIPKPNMNDYYKKDETYSSNELDEKLSNHYTKDETYTQKEVDDELYWKQDRLMSGRNIKTVNGYSLIGSGNIDIDAMIAETFPIQIISDEVHFSTNSPAAWLDFLVENGVEIGEDLTSVPPITVYDALEDMLYVLDLAKFEAGVYYTDPLTQRKVYAKVLNMFEAITQGKLFIWKRIPTADDIGDIGKILDDINGV